QFIQCFIEAPEPNERQAECIVHPRITWGYSNRLTQHRFSVFVAPRLTIEISKIDVRRCVFPTESHRRLISEFGLSSAPTLREKSSKPCARFGSICVDTFRGKQFANRALKTRKFIGRHPFGRNGRQQ